MKPKLLLVLTFLAILLLYSTSFSQQMNSKDLTIPIEAIVGKTPKPFITLKWINSGFPKSFQVYKKLKSDNYFGNPIATLDSGATSWTDTNVVVGTTYEYGILGPGQKYVVIDSANQGYIVFTSTGYTLAGIEVVPALSPGACLLLIDSTMTSLLSNEIDTLKQDLQAEGWEVITQTAPRAESFDGEKVKATKALIANIYNQNKNLKSIILIGRVPVPYSGLLNPDGHPDHYGAWPADVYYGTSDELVWTDITANSTVASRQENKNIPGDGKFDLTTFSAFTTVNFAVGRIDFYNMPLFFDSTKANPEAELLSKYLKRDHQFRTNQIDVEWKGLVDDNFGAQSYPEGFAASGWRAFTNFFPNDSVKVADFITTLSTNTYLWAYGCGGGWYTSAGGIGNSSDFAAKKNNGLFTMLFGSYFGDWDYQNAFMRSALASTPGALTIGWSGRPHWFLHHMNLAEPIGTSLLATQNNNNLYYPNIYYSSQYPNGVLYTTGTRQIHIALLGDPTLKMFNNDVPSPIDLQLTEQPDSKIKLDWKAPTQPGEYVYAVYRITNKNSNVVLVTGNPISDLTFTDNFKYDGTITYYVKALKLGTSRSGSFYYSSNPITSSIKTVSVEEEMVSDINMYPNPASEKLNIEFTASANISEVKITNLSGNLINTFSFESSIGLKNSLVWNLNDLNGFRIPAGVYLIKITSGTEIKVKKIIVF